MFIAAFTAFTFFVTSLGISPNAFASAAMPEVSFPYQLAIDRNLGFAIPQKLGKLEHFSAGQGGRPVVFHLQTAHGHYQAQQQIRQILHYLDKHYGVRTVLVEGSAFQLDPELLNFFPQDKELTRKVNDALTQQAIVKGPELYLLEAKGAKAYGIEDLAAYRENGVSFVNVLEEQQKTERFLADMNMQIERLSSHFLNKDLRDFLRRVENFEKNQVPLDTWLANLKTEAQKRLAIDLVSPAYQLDWPMMVRLSKIQELSQKLDRDAFPKERDVFLKAIKRFLPGNGKRVTGNDPFNVQRSAFTAIESLLRNDSMSQQLPDPETSLLFEDMVRRLPENFNYDAFPNVCYFIGALLLQSELKADRLMLEARKLTDTIAEKLTRNPGEKKLIALLEDHRLLQKLFALELTPADYEAILKGREKGRKPSLLVSKMQNAARSAGGVARTKDIQFSHIADLDMLFDKAMRFYGGVKERDTLMMKRVEERLKETGADRAAVITGGFHAQPFQDYFSGKNYTYALISPTLSGADEAGYQAYIQNMLQSAERITRGAKNTTRGKLSSSIKSGISSTNEATRETVFPSDRQVLAPKNLYGLDQPALREMVRSVIRSVAGGAMPVRSEMRDVAQGFPGLTAFTSMKSLAQVVAEEGLERIITAQINEKSVDFSDPAWKNQDQRGGSITWKSIPFTGDRLRDGALVYKAVKVLLGEGLLNDAIRLYTLNYHVLNKGQRENISTKLLENYKGDFRLVGKMGGTEIQWALATPAGIVTPILSERTHIGGLGESVESLAQRPENSLDAIMRRLVTPMVILGAAVGAERIRDYYFSAPGFFKPDGSLAEAQKNIANMPAGFRFDTEIPKYLFQETGGSLGARQIQIQGQTVHDGTGHAKGDQSVYGPFSQNDLVYGFWVGTGIATRALSRGGVSFTGGEVLNHLHNEGPHQAVWDPATKRYQVVYDLTHGYHPDFTTPGAPLFGREDLEDRTSGKGMSNAFESEYRIALGETDHRWHEEALKIRDSLAGKPMDLAAIRALAQSQNPFMVAVYQARAYELGLGIAELLNYLVTHYKNEFPDIQAIKIPIGGVIAQLNALGLFNMVNTAISFRLLEMGYPRSVVDAVAKNSAMSPVDDDMRELLGGLPPQNFETPARSEMREKDGFWAKSHRPAEQLPSRTLKPGPIKSSLVWTLAKGILWLAGIGAAAAIVYWVLKTGIEREDEREQIKQEMIDESHQPDPQNRSEARGKGVMAVTAGLFLAANVAGQILLPDPNLTAANLTTLPSAQAGGVIDVGTSVPTTLTQQSPGWEFDQRYNVTPANSASSSVVSFDDPLTAEVESVNLRNAGPWILGLSDPGKPVVVTLGVTDTAGKTGFAFFSGVNATRGYWNVDFTRLVDENLSPSPADMGHARLLFLMVLHEGVTQYTSTLHFEIKGIPFELPSEFIQIQKDPADGKIKLSFKVAENEPYEVVYDLESSDAPQGPWAAVQSGLTQKGIVTLTLEVLGKPKQFYRIRGQRIIVNPVTGKKNMAALLSSTSVFTKAADAVRSEARSAIRTKAEVLLPLALLMLQHGIYFNDAAQFRLNPSLIQSVEKRRAIAALFDQVHFDPKNDLAMHSLARAFNLIDRAPQLVAIGENPAKGIFLGNARNRKQRLYIFDAKDRANIPANRLSQQLAYEPWMPKNVSLAWNGNVMTVSNGQSGLTMEVPYRHDDLGSLVALKNAINLVAAASAVRSEARPEVMPERIVLGIKILGREETSIGGGTAAMAAWQIQVEDPRQGFMELLQTAGFDHVQIRKILALLRQKTFSVEYLAATASGVSYNPMIRMGILGAPQTQFTVEFVSSPENKTIFNLEAAGRAKKIPIEQQKEIVLEDHQIIVFPKRTGNVPSNDAELRLRISEQVDEVLRQTKLFYMAQMMNQSEAAQVSDEAVDKSRVRLREMFETWVDLSQRSLTDEIDMDLSIVDREAAAMLLPPEDRTAAVRAGHIAQVGFPIPLAEAVIAQANPTVYKIKQAIATLKLAPRSEVRREKTSIISAQQPAWKKWILSVFAIALASVPASAQVMLSIVKGPNPTNVTLNITGPYNAYDIRQFSPNFESSSVLTNVAASNGHASYVHSFNQSQQGENFFSAVGNTSVIPLVYQHGPLYGAPPVASDSITSDQRWVINYNFALGSQQALGAWGYFSNAVLPIQPMVLRIHLGEGVNFPDQFTLLFSGSNGLVLTTPTGLHPGQVLEIPIPPKDFPQEYRYVAIQVDRSTAGNPSGTLNIANMYFAPSRSEARSPEGGDFIPREELPPGFDDGTNLGRNLENLGIKDLSAAAMEGLESREEPLDKLMRNHPLRRSEMRASVTVKADGKIYHPAALKETGLGFSLTAQGDTFLIKVFDAGNKEITRKKSFGAGRNAASEISAGGFAITFVKSKGHYRDPDVTLDVMESAQDDSAGTLEEVAARSEARDAGTKAPAENLGWAAFWATLPGIPFLSQWKVINQLLLVFASNKGSPAATTARYQIHGLVNRMAEDPDLRVQLPLLMSQMIPEAILLMTPGQFDLTVAAAEELIAEGLDPQPLFRILVADIAEVSDLKTESLSMATFAEMVRDAKASVRLARSESRTPAEAYQARLKVLDRLADIRAFSPIFGYAAVAIYNLFHPDAKLSIETVATNARAHADMRNWVTERYGKEVIMGNMDIYLLIEAVLKANGKAQKVPEAENVSVSFDDENSLAPSLLQTLEQAGLNLDKLVPAKEVLGFGRIKQLAEFFRIMETEHPGEPRIAKVIAPASLVTMMMDSSEIAIGIKIPDSPEGEKFRKIMQYAEEVVAAMSEYLVTEGHVDGIVYLEPTATGLVAQRFIRSLDDYEAFGVAPIRRLSDKLHELGALSGYHPCCPGHDKAMNQKIMERFTKIKGLDLLSIDAVYDLDAIYDHLENVFKDEPRRPVLIGNLKTGEGSELAEGDESAVRAAVENLFTRMGSRRFIVATSCDLNIAGSLRDAMGRQAYLEHLDKNVRAFSTGSRELAQPFRTAARSESRTVEQIVKVIARSIALVVAASMAFLFSYMTAGFGLAAIFSPLIELLSPENLKVSILDVPLENGWAKVGTTIGLLGPLSFATWFPAKFFVRTTIALFQQIKFGFMKDSRTDLPLKWHKALRNVKLSLLDRMIPDRGAKRRAQAAKILGDLKDPRAVTALNLALNDRSEKVRKAAIAALAKIQDFPSATRSEMRSSKTVHFKVFRDLVTVGLTLAVSGLVGCGTLFEEQQSSAPEVRMQTPKPLTLEEQRWRDSGVLMERFEKNRNDPEVLAAVRALLKSSDPSIVSRTARALIDSGYVGGDVWEYYRGSLERHEITLNTSDDALWALLQANDLSEDILRDVAALRYASFYPKVRSNAEKVIRTKTNRPQWSGTNVFEAIKVFGEDRWVPRAPGFDEIKKIVRDREVLLRVYILGYDWPLSPLWTWNRLDISSQISWGFGAAATPTLLKYLDGQQWSVRAGVAQALGSIYTSSQYSSSGGRNPVPAEVINALISKLGDNQGWQYGTVSTEAAHALGEMGSKAKAAVPALVAILEKNYSEQWNQLDWIVVGALGKIQDPRAMPVLKSFLQKLPQDPDWGKHIRESLGKIQGGTAVNQPSKRSEMRKGQPQPGQSSKDGKEIKHILVLAEDDPRRLDTDPHYLREAGYDVTVVSVWDQEKMAQAMTSQKPVDLIISNWVFQPGGYLGALDAVVSHQDVRVFAPKLIQPFNPQGRIPVIFLSYQDYEDQGARTYIEGLGNGSAVLDAAIHPKVIQRIVGENIPAALAEFQPASPEQDFTFSSSADAVRWLNGAVQNIEANRQASRAKQARGFGPYAYIGMAAVGLTQAVLLGARNPDDVLRDMADYVKDLPPEMLPNTAAGWKRLINHEGAWEALTASAAVLRSESREAVGVLWNETQDSHFVIFHNLTVGAKDLSALGAMLSLLQFRVGSVSPTDGLFLQAGRPMIREVYHGFTFRVQNGAILSQGVTAGARKSSLGEVLETTEKGLGAYAVKLNAPDGVVVEKNGSITINFASIPFSFRSAQELQAVLGNLAKATARAIDGQQIHPQGTGNHSQKFDLAGDSFDLSKHDAAEASRLQAALAALLSRSEMRKTEIIPAKFRPLNPDIRELPFKEGDEIQGHKVYPRLVPASAAAAQVDELKALRILLDPRKGARALLVKGYDQMTYLSVFFIVVLELLTLSKEVKQKQFSFGLATGGTTESARKFLGLLEKIKEVYGEEYLLRILHALGAEDIKTLDWQKVVENVESALTLDDYYFGAEFAAGANNQVAQVSAYRNEQLYMMLMNFFGIRWNTEAERTRLIEKIFAKKFISPPLFQKAMELAERLFRRALRWFDQGVALIAPLLWKINGGGTDGHEGFDESAREAPDTSKPVVTDIVGLLTAGKGNEDIAAIIDGLKILDHAEPLFRPDGKVELYDITRVQNAFHFIPKPWHPFFLRFMGDKKTWNLLDTFEVLKRMPVEEILTYYKDAKSPENPNEPDWQFQNQEQFLEAFRYLLRNFQKTPAYGITQKTGGLVDRLEGAFNFLMINGRHKHRTFSDIWNSFPTNKTTGSFFHTLGTTVLVTEDAFYGTSPDAIPQDESLVFKFTPENKAAAAKVTRGNIDAWWGETAEGQRFRVLHKTPTALTLGEKWPMLPGLEVQLRSKDVGESGVGLVLRSNGLSATATRVNAGDSAPQTIGEYLFLDSVKTGDSIRITLEPDGEPHNRTTYSLTYQGTDPEGAYVFIPAMVDAPVVRSEMRAEVGKIHERDTERLAAIETTHAEVFGKAPAVVTLGPGRGNIEGEHVDYPDYELAMLATLVNVLRYRHDVPDGVWRVVTGVNPYDIIKVRKMSGAKLAKVSAQIDAIRKVLETSPYLQKITKLKSFQDLLPENFSLPFSSHYNILVAGTKNKSGKIRVHAMDYKDTFEFSLAELAELVKKNPNPEVDPKTKEMKDPDYLAYLQKNGLDFGGKHRWAAYWVGLYWEALKRGGMITVKDGADFTVQGNIPKGSGMSSSAGLEVAMTGMAEELFGWKFATDDAKAKMARTGEVNPFVRSGCGLLDQMGSMKGKEGQAFKVSYKNLNKVEYTPLAMGPYQFVMVNTRGERELAQTDYDTRAAFELPEAPEIMNDLLGYKGKRLKFHVSSFTWQEFKNIEARFLARNETVAKRTRHVIGEKMRTQKMHALFGEAQELYAAKRNDKALLKLLEIGRLLNESGNSMMMDGDFAISGKVAALREDGEMTKPLPLLDYLVKLGREENAGVRDLLPIFARMMGGGGGGVAIFMVPKGEQFETWKKRLTEEYFSQTGVRLTDEDFILGIPSDGARTIARSEMRGVVVAVIPAGKRTQVHQDWSEKPLVIRLDQAPYATAEQIALRFGSSDLLSPNDFRRKGLLITLKKGDALKAHYLLVPQKVWTTKPSPTIGSFAFLEWRGWELDTHRATGYVLGDDPHSPDVQKFASDLFTLSPHRTQDVVNDLLKPFGAFTLTLDRTPQSREHQNFDTVEIRLVPPDEAREAMAARYFTPEYVADQFDARSEARTDKRGSFAAMFEQLAEWREAGTEVVLVRRDESVTQGVIANLQRNPHLIWVSDASGQHVATLAADQLDWPATLETMVASGARSEMRESFPRAPREKHPLLGLAAMVGFLALVMGTLVAALISEKDKTQNKTSLVIPAANAPAPTEPGSRSESRAPKTVAKATAKTAVKEHPVQAGSRINLYESPGGKVFAYFEVVDVSSPEGLEASVDLDVFAFKDKQISSVQIKEGRRLTALEPDTSKIAIVPGNEIIVKRSGKTFRLKLIRIELSTAIFEMTPENMMGTKALARSEARGMTKKEYAAFQALKREPQRRVSKYKSEEVQTRFQLTSREAKSVLTKLDIAARSEARRGMTDAVLSLDSLPKIESNLQSRNVRKAVGRLASVFHLDTSHALEGQLTQNSIQPGVLAVLDKKTGDLKVGTVKDGNLALSIEFKNVLEYGLIGEQDGSVRLVVAMQKGERPVAVLYSVAKGTLSGMKLNGQWALPVQSFRVNNPEGQDGEKIPAWFLESVQSAVGQNQRPQVILGFLPPSGQEKIWFSSVTGEPVVRSESRVVVEGTIAARRKAFVDDLARVKLAEAGYILVQDTPDSMGLHLTIRRDASIPEDQLTAASQMLSFQFRQRFPGQQLYISIQRAEPKPSLPRSLRVAAARSEARDVTVEEVDAFWGQLKTMLEPVGGKFFSANDQMLGAISLDDKAPDHPEFAGFIQHLDHSIEYLNKPGGSSFTMGLAESRIEVLGEKEREQIASYSGSFPVLAVLQKKADGRLRFVLASGTIKTDGRHDDLKLGKFLPSEVLVEIDKMGDAERPYVVLARLVSKQPVELPVAAKPSVPKFTGVVRIPSPAKAAPAPVTEEPVQSVASAAPGTVAPTSGSSLKLAKPEQRLVVTTAEGSTVMTPAQLVDHLSQAAAVPETAAKPKLPGLRLAKDAQVVPAGQKRYPGAPDLAEDGTPAPAKSRSLWQRLTGRSEMRENQIELLATPRDYAAGLVARGLPFQIQLKWGEHTISLKYHEVKGRSYRYSVDLNDVPAASLYVRFKGPASQTFEYQIRDLGTKRSPQISEVQYAELKQALGRWIGNLNHQWSAGQIIRKTPFSAKPPFKFLQANGALKLDLSQVPDLTRAHFLMPVNAEEARELIAKLRKAGAKKIHTVWGTDEHIAPDTPIAVLANIDMRNYGKDWFLAIQVEQGIPLVTSRKKGAQPQDQSPAFTALKEAFLEARRSGQKKPAPGQRPYARLIRAAQLAPALPARSESRAIVETVNTFVDLLAEKVTDTIEQAKRVENAQEQGDRVAVSFDGNLNGAEFWGFVQSAETSEVVFYSGGPSLFQFGLEHSALQYKDESGAFKTAQEFNGSFPLRAVVLDKQAEDGIRLVVEGSAFAGNEWLDGLGFGRIVPVEELKADQAKSEAERRYTVLAEYRKLRLPALTARQRITFADASVPSKPARSESRADISPSKALKLMPMEELVASEALRSWLKLPGNTHKHILEEYSRLEGRYRFVIRRTLNTPYKWAIEVQGPRTHQKIAELFLQTDQQHPNLELVDYRAKAGLKEPVRVHVATEPALALNIVSGAWPRIEVVFPDAVAKKFKGQVPEGLPIQIVPESEAVRRSESRAAVYPAAGDAASMIRELYQQEPWLARVTQKLRFGVMALRIMDALKQAGALGQRMIERVSGISLANAAETASARQAVTLASRPEALNPKNVEAARAVFGETKNRTSDAFIFDATFAFDRFAIAALRPVFGDIPMIVMVRNDTEEHRVGDRAKLARVNFELTKAGRPEILQADNLDGVKAFMTVEKSRQVGIGRELRFKAIVDTSDSMAIALKEMIPDFLPVNDENFKSFMFQAGEVVRALVASIRAQFATRKSA